MLGKDEKGVKSIVGEWTTRQPQIKWLWSYREEKIDYVDWDNVLESAGFEHPISLKSSIDSITDWLRFVAVGINKRGLLKWLKGEKWFEAKYLTDTAPVYHSYLSSLKFGYIIEVCISEGFSFSR